jgi:DNA-directed RNA polymerase
MILRQLIEPMAASVQEFVDDAMAGKAGKHTPLAKFLTQLTAEDIAFATCRGALNAMTQGRIISFASVCHALGKTLERASLSEAIRATDPKAFNRLMTKMAKAPWPSKRHILLRKAGEKAKVTTIPWDPEVTPVRIGALLFTLLEASTQHFKVVQDYKGGRSANQLQFSDELVAALETLHGKHSLWTPAYLPMVVTPRAWSRPWNGGYLDKKGLGLKLLNARHINKNYLGELNNKPLPMVYDALNALQQTPWRINQPVADTLATIWNGNLPLGKLPTKGKLPLPVAPWGSGAAPTEEARKEHTANLARTHDANHKLDSKRRSIAQKLWVAERFASFEHLYFPHVLDFRGRMYPVVGAVNPQSDDSGRALLEFGEGVALGEGGAYWLAVHGANSFGIDKVAYETRAEWVDENTDMILACAKDPLANVQWSDADSPFMFLAFCFEWERVQAHVDAGNEPATFVSHLPVSWDGSCNGLQNFSAMLRDPIGGAATNLLPAAAPNDVYQQVADVVSVQVEKDAARGEVNAMYWRGNVTRNVTKRPTMTLPYGSGRYGFRSQVLEMMDKHKLETGKQFLDGGDPFLCSVYISNVIYDALGQVVVAARQAMDWLREVSTLAAKDGLPVLWTTPAGFPVMQEYRELIGTKVAMYVCGRRIEMKLNLRSDRIDVRKQEQGISPNFVHSLDAAHLMRTVTKAVAGGMRSFAMVHDSYGTHAGNAGVLHRILREAFVEQYSGDVLTDFLMEIAGRLPPELAAKLPPPPSMGTLDLGAVMDSDYFFA